MARTTSKVFGEVETFEDLKGVVFQSLLNNNHYYMDDVALQTALTCLQSADEKQQKQILKYARHVDRKLSAPGTTRGNIYHKLPAFLAGSIYLISYPDAVSDLNFDELTLLSRYATFSPPEFFEPTVLFFGKELLGAITAKHFDYMFQWTFLNYAESKLTQRQSKEEVASYIRETPIEQLKEEAFEYTRTALAREIEALEGVGKYL